MLTAHAYAVRQRLPAGLRSLPKCSCGHLQDTFDDIVMDDVPDLAGSLGGFWGSLPQLS